MYLIFYDLNVAGVMFMVQLKEHLITLHVLVFFGLGLEGGLE